MDDPDYPAEAVNSNIIVEEIEMNGVAQKIYKKTYYLIDGKEISITRTEKAWAHTHQPLSKSGKARTRDTHRNQK